MAAAHKGAISFGLVHIPVQLFKTTQNNDISFNQLCKETKERIRYRKFCPNCKKEVKSSDIVKGYQYEKDKYVVMQDDELEAIKTEKDRTIHILQFTQLEDIDDIYYEKNYYAIPEKTAEKAYELLRSAMYAQKVVAIAKTVMHTKETLLALCPKEDGILIKTLFYKDEIASQPKDIVQPKTNKTELSMAKQLIKSMTKAYDPDAFHDEYQERLYALIMDKVKGNDVVYSDQGNTASTTPIDLMDALKQSIASIDKTKPKTKRVRH